MGNSAAEFAKRNPGFRNRHSTQISFSGPSYYWFTERPANPEILSSGSASQVVDTNHPGWYSWQRMLRNSATPPVLRNVDYGSTFLKESVSLSAPSYVSAQQPIGSTFRGHEGLFPTSQGYRNIMVNMNGGKFPSIPTGLGIDPLSLWGLGSTAVAKSIPEIPEFSLFRFVGELKAGLPKIPLQVLAKEKKLRNAGGEYLNVQFGIMPLVSDLQDFFEALQNPALRSAVEHQLNKEFRVRKVLDKGYTSTTRTMTQVEMTTVQGRTGSSGTATKYSQWRVWSSCSFAYHQVSLLDDLLKDLDKQLGGLGAVPTAIDVWNLLPWSWLVDWFVNINHVITNLSYLGRDGLYLRHGYLMGTYRDREVQSQNAVIFGRPSSTTQELLFERKYRVRASPFGFGYTWKDFNPFQISILGALGVNRLRY